MKKVKSGKSPAEATRTAPKAAAAAPVAVPRGAEGSGVKQRAGATRVETPERRRPVKAKVAKVSRVRRAPGTRGKVAKAKRGATTPAKKKPVAPPAKAAPPVLQIRRLDPVRVCGDRTSVVQLFRVDEEAVAVGKAAGARQVHLVFNDRHGWYCEHGRSCHAVSAVMRHAGIR